MGSSRIDAGRFGGTDPAPGTGEPRREMPIGSRQSRPQRSRLTANRSDRVPECPLMVTTGVGAAMTALPAGHKYLEERREISLSDMYFLWQAQVHMREDA